MYFKLTDFNTTAHGVSSDRKRGQNDDATNGKLIINNINPCICYVPMS